jgi:hypothetical protein
LRLAIKETGDRKSYRVPRAPLSDNLP